MPAASLLYATASERLRQHPPQRIGIMHALPRPELDALLAQAPEYRLQQYFRDFALALNHSGYPCHHQLDGQFDLILINPSKNRRQTLGWIATALQHIRPSGRIMLCLANKHGAKGLESRLRALTGQLISFSKSKCRCMYFSCGDIDHAELIPQWQEQAAMRQLAESGLYSMPGLFSWENPDPGSQLLLEHIPDVLRGTGMDLCCGNGFLAKAIIRQASGIRQLHLVDHDRLALDCARATLCEYPVPYVLHWLDASSEVLPQPLDWIVCNPPFHRQQEQNIELGQAIIQQACASLKHGGHIWMVANRKLPYEKILGQRLAKVDIIIQQQGYKIIHGVRR